MLLKAHVLLAGSLKAPIPFPENHLGLLILRHLAPISSLVHVLNLLNDLFTVHSHFLVNDTTLVKVVLFEFLGAAELHMLVHETWFKLSLHQYLRDVLLHD